MENRVNHYEVGYLLAPTLPPEEAVAFAAKNFKPAVVEAGGGWQAEGAPRSIGLAYPIRQVVENQRHLWQESYFGWSRFSLPAGITPEFFAQWRGLPGVVRALLFRVAAPARAVAADSKLEVAPRRPVVKKKEKVPAEAPASPADIDKQIDQLLTNVS